MMYTGKLGLLMGTQEQKVCIISFLPNHTHLPGHLEILENQ